MKLIDYFERIVLIEYFQLIEPVIEDSDTISSEVHRQTSLCQCSNKYDVEQIAEGRYRVGEKDS